MSLRKLIGEYVYRAQKQFGFLMADNFESIQFFEAH